MTVQHSTWTEPVAGTGQIAKCSCGWTGDIRDTWAEAQSDRNLHKGLHELTQEEIGNLRRRFS